MKRTHLLWLIPLIAGVSLAASTRPGGDTVLKQDEYKVGIKVTGGTPAADTIVKSGGKMNINNGAITSDGTETIIGGVLRANSMTTVAGDPPPGMVPIGGMVAVMPHLHANAWQPPASGAVKDGFMRADGAAVPGSCTDCVIPSGTAMPNMTNRYLRGNTNSGAIAGSNTHTPTGTVSQPTFAGAGVLKSEWFGTTAVSATAGFTGTGVAYSTWFKTGSVTASFAGTASLRSTWFGTSAVTATFAGTSATYTVSVPGHYHDKGTGTLAIAASGSTTVTGTVGGSDGTHTHTLTNPTVARSDHFHFDDNLIARYNASGNYSYFDESANPGKGVSPTWNSTWAMSHPSAGGSNTTNFSSGMTVYGYTGTPQAPTSTASVPVAGSITVSVNTTSSGHGHGHSLTAPNHTHAASSFSGTIGLTTGSNGNAAFSATGSNTPAGTVTLATANDNMAEWSAAGSYTPEGTVTMAAANDTFKEWAESGNYTPAGTVSVTMAAASDNMADWAAAGSYTPTGTVSQPSFTGNSQNTEPAYMEVVWVVRVK